MNVSVKIFPVEKNRKILNQGHSKREMWKQIERYSGISWNPRAHTGQVSPETGSWKGVRDPDSFLLSHSCCLSLASFFPFICPFRLLPLWYTKTFHVFASQRQEPPLPSSYFLRSCAQHSLLEHLHIQFSGKGAGVGRKGGLVRLATCSVSSTYLCDCTRAGLWERAQWAELTPLKVPGALTLRHLILGPCAL